MTGPRLVDRWLSCRPGRPCVVKDPIDAEERPRWWASPACDDPDRDLGFDTWREAYDWLDRTVRGAQ